MPDDNAPPDFQQHRSSEPRELEITDVAAWLESAEQRDDPYWEAIMTYVTGPLRKRSPARSVILEKQLKWLRQQAHKDGIVWGRQEGD